MHVLTIVVLALWLLAFGRTLLNLRLIPRLSRAATPLREPLVSIVVPARNEARVIERTVRAFLAQDYRNFEVIVVDDRSTDQTGEMLRAIDDPRLTVVSGEESPPGWLGKPWALEQGSARARGEMLLFVDADVIYAPTAVRAAVAELEKSGAAMIALLPHFELGGIAEQIAMPMLAFTGFAAVPTWYFNRSRAAFLAMGGGSGNLIRRDIFQAVGGFRSLKDAVVDDIALARLVRHQGDSTRAVRADDLISVRMYHSAREIIGGFSKNIFFVVGRSYVLGVVMLVLLVVCHLLPYALAFMGDWTSIATVVVITMIRLVLFRSLRYSLINALLFHPFMVVFWSYLFLHSMWFTGVRKELRWRGRIYDAAQTRFGA